MNKQQMSEVVAILKRKFNNLSVEETLDLAWRIIEAVESNVNHDTPQPKSQ